MYNVDYEMPQLLQMLLHIQVTADVYLLTLRLAKAAALDTQYWIQSSGLIPHLSIHLLALDAWFDGSVTSV